MSIICQLKMKKKALQKLANFFHAYYLTKAVKQYQSAFKNSVREQQQLAAP